MFENRRAGDLGELVLAVLAELKADPEKYRGHNPPNGWGTYEGLAKEFEGMLAAIEATPNAIVETWL